MHLLGAKLTSAAAMATPLLAQVSDVRLPQWVGVAGSLGLAALGALIARTFAALDRRDDDQAKELTTLRERVTKLEAEQAAGRDVIARCRNCRFIIAG